MIHSTMSHLSEYLNSYQGLLESLERARVQHFLLDLSRVRAPGHQKQLLLLGALGGSLK